MLLTPAFLAAAVVGDPNAFDGTQDPLTATFDFDGRKFIAILSHLASRSGSTPIFGGPQPLVQAGEAKREAQMRALADYVDFLFGEGDDCDDDDDDDGDDARIIVLGDLNTVEYTNDPTEILPGTGSEKVLINLIDSLWDDNVYTYNFEGNSQVLDHVLATRSLLGRAELDIVQVILDSSRIDDTVGSDHEPIVARFGSDEDFGRLRGVSTQRPAG